MNLSDSQKAIYYLKNISKSYPDHSTELSINNHIDKLNKLLFNYDKYFFKNNIDNLKTILNNYIQYNYYRDLIIPKNMKSICYLLNSTELTNPPLIQTKYSFSILRLMELYWKDSFLTPLIILYLDLYGKDYNKDLYKYIQKILISKLNSYKGRNNIPNTIKRLPYIIKNNNLNIFENNMYKDYTDWFNLCNNYKISVSLQRTTFFCFAFLNFIENINISLNIEYLNDQYIENIKNIYGKNTTICFIAILINKKNSNISSLNKLIPLAFKYIGDPLYPLYWECTEKPYNNYNETLNKARLIILKIINKNIFDYFFEKVNINDKRKEFWSQYINKMDNIRIVIHTNNNNYFSSNKEFNEWIKNRVINVKKNTNDIGLLLEYNNWIIFEVGETGHACYFYNKYTNSINNLNNEILDFNQLKNTRLNTLTPINYDGEGRFIHNNNWQYDLAFILDRKLGI